MINLSVSNKTYDKLRDQTERLYEWQGCPDRRRAGFLLYLLERVEKMDKEELRMIGLRGIGIPVEKEKKLRAQLHVVRGGAA